ncbi:MAG: hypothetical protein QXR48_03305 [Candidatus Woesearchaeota archaeon]
MKRGITLLTAILIAGMLIPVTEATTVVIDSQEWIDVYSGMLYARLTGNPSIFFTSKKYITIMPNLLSPGEELIIIESERLPYAANAAGTLRRQGYNPKTTIFSRGGYALNLELAKSINVSKFIIVDPTYGFNAVSVAPYAIATKSYVLFAEDKNIDQVFTYLVSLPKIEKIVIYGAVSDTVLKKLSAFSPEIINTGNRYKDNIEILKRYFQINPSTPQAILTSGEFLEQEIIGGEPIILVGKERVVQNTIDFVKNSNLKTTVLIGNELTGTAKLLKEQTGRPVFVKLGQGVPMGEAQYQPIKALDMFFLPTLNIQVDLGYIQYNTIEKKLEIVYRNRGVRAFLSGTIGLLVDGKTVATVGDKDVQTLEKNETKGIRYDVDLSEYISQNKKITADILTIYGESPEIMDRAIAAQIDVRVGSADDQCELRLGPVSFDERTQRISVGLENPTSSECYAAISLIDVIIEDKKQNINYPGQAYIPPRSRETFKIKQRMTPVDLEDNPTVHVRIVYGEREGLLFKALDAIVPFRKSSGYAGIILFGIIAVLLIIIIIIFVLWRKTKNKKLSQHFEYRKWR